MQQELSIAAALMDCPSLAPLARVSEAIAKVGIATPPLPVLAAASGACPRAVFDAGVSVQELLERQFQSDSLLEACVICGVEAAWEAEEASIARHLSAGGAAVAKTDVGWRVLSASEADGDRLSVRLVPHWAGPEQGPFALLIRRSATEGRAISLRADQILTRVAQASQDRGSTIGDAAVGPVAIDTLRRALARVSQEGFEKWPEARGWLLTVLRDVAGQMLVAGEALRHVLSGLAIDRHLVMAAQAAIGNFDVAASFACGTYLIAEAVFSWPARAGSDEASVMDAAHWGAVYEMLRQIAYHWRAAAGWIARELFRAQSAFSGSLKSEPNG